MRHRNLESCDMSPLKQSLEQAAAVQGRADSKSGPRLCRLRIQSRVVPTPN